MYPRRSWSDLLFQSPKTAAELSRLTDTHQRSLLRLMRGLVALAICTEATDGRFQLTEMGPRLAAKSERSLKAWARFEGEMLRLAVWSGLIESVRTGKTANELAVPCSGMVRETGGEEARWRVQPSHGLNDTYRTASTACRATSPESQLLWMLAAGLAT
jgi:hypothetical protein